MSSEEKEGEGCSLAAGQAEEARLQELEASREKRLKLTRADLLRYDRLLRWLLTDGIPGRRRRRGRYPKDDTARCTYIRSVALPNLCRGRLPSVEDWGFLFGHTLAELAESHAAGKKSADYKRLDAWAGTVHQDPRSRSSRPTQRSILEWAVKNDAMSPITVRLPTMMCVRTVRSHR